MANDMDFIGFEYNGTHSSYYEIFRTSDGSRYSDNLIPQLMDKTADVPGGDGQYYFRSFYKTRQFSISIAFENLSEEKYKAMRSWLDGKGIHDLIFDEAPYKVYSAKVTGTPQLKTICFEDDGARVYKGEGTIQFTCYYPFAHTPTITNQGFDGRILSNYTEELYPTKNQWASASGITDSFVNGDNLGDLPAPFKVKKSDTTNMNTSFTVGENTITIKESAVDLEWDSKTGLVTSLVDGKRVPISYTGTSYGTLPTGSNALILNGATIEYDYWYY